MNKIINLYDLIGPYCVASQDGYHLSYFLSEYLKQNEPISLNFDKVENLTTAFLNGVYSSLYENYTHEKITNNIKVENLNFDFEKLINLVRMNLIRYYNDEEYRKRVDEVMKEFEEDERY